MAGPSVTGLHNRVYTGHEPLTMTNSAGNRATVDGHGDDEVKPMQAEWMALFGPRGACALVPERPTGTSYWDAGGSWGGFGWHHAPERSREWFIFRANATDDSFAKEAWEQLRHPLEVHAE